MLAQNQEGTDNRPGLLIDPNSCLSNLSNLLESTESTKFIFHLGKTQLMDFARSQKILTRSTCNYVTKSINITAILQYLKK